MPRCHFLRFVCSGAEVVRAEGYSVPAYIAARIDLVQGVVGLSQIHRAARFSVSIAIKK